MFLNRKEWTISHWPDGFSVPCRGAMFLNSGWVTSLNRWIHYFRPLSGSYVSQYLVYRRSYITHIKFPSPVGELCFSIKLNYTERRSMNNFRPLSGSYVSQLTFQIRPDNIDKFPSPVGELCFSIISCRDKPKLQQKFPSPVGELCFSIVTKNLYEHQVRNFRPLSGSYVSQSKKTYNTYCDVHFRPLSGSYVSQ